MNAVLSIAGSDSSGGAGIQADLKTIAALGCYGETAITALTAQNTTGVFGILPIDPDFIVAQIDAVFDDIRPDAVKIGMVSDAEAVVSIGRALRRHEATHIVVDPVMVATSGATLSGGAVVEALRRELFPIAEVITPNRLEAEVLAGRPIPDEPAMEKAAEAIAREIGAGMGSLSGVDGADVAPPTVLIKGGHGVGPDDESNDLVRLPDGEFVWLRGSRFDNPNTHGTGCTLSSAIACGLARGLDVLEALRNAKVYVARAIAANLDLGRGNGPLNHFIV